MSVQSQSWILQSFVCIGLNYWLPARIQVPLHLPYARNNENSSAGKTVRNQSKTLSSLLGIRGFLVKKTYVYDIASQLYAILSAITIRKRRFSQSLIQSLAPHTKWTWQNEMQILHSTSGPATSERNINMIYALRVLTFQTYPKGPIPLN